MSLRDTLEQSFETYAGMTIRDRAICDVRDCLKPGARMSMYAQYIDKITPEASFIDDLGADSLDMVELILAIEEEYGFEVSEEDATKISTVGEACEYIKNAIGE